MIPAVPGPQNHALNRLPSIAGWRRGQGVLCLGGQGFSAISLRRKGGTVMQKTYVLDTNVLIQSPEALEAFEDNHIVLPLAVLEELDGLKHAEGEQGTQCPAGDPLPGASCASQGSLVEGVSLPGRRHAAAGGQPCGGAPCPTAWTRTSAGQPRSEGVQGAVGGRAPRRCW